jgi:hypothetical protein
MFWIDGDVYYGSNPFEQTDLYGGILIDFDWCHGYLVVVEDVKPTCEQAGILWLGCSDGCGIGTGLAYSAPLGHDYVATGEFYFGGADEAQGEWYQCTKCGGLEIR